MNNYSIRTYLCVILMLFLPVLCFADDIPASECPAVPAIIAAGVKNAEHDPKYPTVWTVMNNSDHFGTKYIWSLEIEFISAPTAAAAIAKANTALNTLVFSGVDMFFCIYKGENDGEEITGRALKIAG